MLNCLFQILRCNLRHRLHLWTRCLLWKAWFRFGPFWVPTFVLSGHMIAFESEYQPTTCLRFQSGQSWCEYYHHQAENEVACAQNLLRMEILRTKNMFTLWCQSCYPNFGISAYLDRSGPSLKLASKCFASSSLTFRSVCNVLPKPVSRYHISANEMYQWNHPSWARARESNQSRSSVSSNRAVLWR